jgi:hypothetical protein
MIKIIDIKNAALSGTYGKRCKKLYLSTLTLTPIVLLLTMFFISSNLLHKTRKNK